MWTLYPDNPDIFFIQWRNKMELSSLPWILYSRRRPRPMLCCQYSWRSPENSSESRYVSDTQGRANSICIRIRADVEIFESGKKKLRIQKYPYRRGRDLRIVFFFALQMNDVRSANIDAPKWNWLLVVPLFAYKGPWWKPELHHRKVPLQWQWHLEK